MQTHPSRPDADNGFQMGRDANAELPFNLTETDRLVLSQTDEDFEAHDWENLQKLIGDFIPCPDPALLYVRC